MAGREHVRSDFLLVRLVRDELRQIRDVTADIVSWNPPPFGPRSK
jgi:hypothetical protein